MPEVNQARAVGMKPDFYSNISFTGVGSDIVTFQRKLSVLRAQ